VASSVFVLENPTLACHGITTSIGIGALSCVWRDSYNAIQPPEREARTRTSAPVVRSDETTARIAISGKHLRGRMQAGWLVNRLLSYLVEVGEERDNLKIESIEARGNRIRYAAVTAIPLLYSRGVTYL